MPQAQHRKPPLTLNASVPFPTIQNVLPFPIVHPRSLTTKIIVCEAAAGPKSLFSVHGQLSFPPLLVRGFLFSDKGLICTPFYIIMLSCFILFSFPSSFIKKNFQSINYNQYTVTKEEFSKGTEPKMS